MLQSIGPALAERGNVIYDKLQYCLKPKALQAGATLCPVSSVNILLHVYSVMEPQNSTMFLVQHMQVLKC